MASYKIKKGDTLSAIARANNTTVDALVKANNIKNKNLIITGKSLTIPGKSQVKTPGANRTGDKMKKSSGTPAAVSGRKVQTTSNRSSSSTSKPSSGYSQQTPRTGSWKDSKLGKSLTGNSNRPKVGTQATSITRGEGKSNNSYSQQTPRTGSWSSSPLGSKFKSGSKVGAKGKTITKGEGGSVKGSWK